MKQGKLTEIRNQDNTISITGEIVTYSMNIQFQMTENKEKRDDKSPTHLVYARGGHGRMFHAGVAWLSSTKDGKPMYSIVFEIEELFEGEKRFCAWETISGTYRIENDKPLDMQKAA